MRYVIAMVPISLAMASSAQVLTFKKGEALGSDGKTYQGASPEQMELLIKRATANDMPAGVVGNNVIVVIGDKVSFVPTSELQGKTNETQLQIIGDQVVQDITGNEDITFDQVQTLNAASEATGQDISELLAEGGIEGLDDDLVAELEQVASETGIDFDNLVAANTVLETLPVGQVKQLMNDLGAMIEEGFADEINETLTALSEIQGGLKNALNFGSYNDCVSGGGSNCAETAAAFGEGPLAE